MKNKRCSVDQRIYGQRTYQRTTEVVPSSAHKDSQRGSKVGLGGLDSYPLELRGWLKYSQAEIEGFPGGLEGCPGELEGFLEDWRMTGGSFH